MTCGEGVGMRVLIIGAGVIGSFNAARLTRAGVDVTLLARGSRLAELKDHGVRLEDVRSGLHTTTRVKLVDRVDPEDTYDLAVVIVRRSQVASVLPMLAQARRIPTVLFLGNSATGPELMIDALGKDRVLTGMVNAGGERERDTGVIRYLWSKRMPLVFGELDGKPSARTASIQELFTRAGLPAHTVTNVEAVQKTHAAGLPGFAGAVYAAGGVRRLAHSPGLLRMFVAAYREVLRGLRADGTPITPASNRLIEWVPELLLVLALRFFLDTRLAVVGGERHAMAAPDEMRELADEIQAILDRTRTPSPATRALTRQIDRQLALAPR